MNGDFATLNAAVSAGSTPPDWAADLFTAPLVPLHDTAGRATPVWSIDADSTGAKISEQFKANAGEYHARYAASAHFEILFRQALTATDLQVAESPLILDLGSGSGVNSVVPSFVLFPGARQVATDLSGELLAILADYAIQTDQAERVLCVEMDAMSSHIAPGRFDLVTGGAILHHLVFPILGLRAAARALKPGGHAIFMEPFDGYGLIRLAYERILAEADLRGEPLAPEVERTFRTMIVDIAARTAPDPRAPGFTDLDDKWLFSREQLDAAARSCGFSDVRFVAHNDHRTLYRDAAFVQMRLGAGRDDLSLPDWAIDILDGFDRALPPAVKRLLILEGSIVLTKGD
jgi:SAM-dependent methyltransferase